MATFDWKITVVDQRKRIWPVSIHKVNISADNMALNYFETGDSPSQLANRDDLDRRPQEAFPSDRLSSLS